jgi:hypothetical protein
MAVASCADMDSPSEWPNVGLKWRLGGEWVRLVQHALVVAAPEEMLIVVWRMYRQPEECLGLHKGAGVQHRRCCDAVEQVPDPVERTRENAQSAKFDSGSSLRGGNEKVPVRGAVGWTAMSENMSGNSSW